MSESSTHDGVSVVIPHYGDPALAMSLVDKLRKQVGSRHIQIIVSDDHSPEPFPSEFGQDCEVLRRTTNDGFGSAVNSGAALATQPLLLILNSDLHIGPSFVDDLCREARPWMPAVAAPAIIGGDGSLAFTARRFPTIARSTIAWLEPLARWRATGMWHRLVGHETRIGRGQTGICDWLVGAVLLIPTEEFGKLGGFDERFFMNSEEVDLQRRARSNGLPSVIIGNIEVVHSGGGSSDEQRRLLWLTQGEWRYFDKWSGAGRARMFEVAVLAACLCNLVWNAARSLVGRDVHPVQKFRSSYVVIREASQR